MDLRVMRSARGDATERDFGFCQAVRTGPFVHASGMTGRGGDGEIVGVGDPYAQAVQALVNLGRALSDCDAALTDVVRTRIYLTNPAHIPAIAKAHGETFSDIRPAATLLVVAGLFEAELLVEIEADVIVAEDLMGPA